MSLMMNNNEQSAKTKTEDGATTTTSPRTRVIRAVYTDATIRVYQAYNNEIADAALEAQSFRAAMDKGIWSPKRMTWIKPSKVWMAYRCGWTVLKNDINQARVLALDLDRSKFVDLLAKATVETTVPHNNNTQKKKKCRDQSVVVQWDPERYIDAKASGKQQVYTKPARNVRSIQIGLRPPANQFLLDRQTVRRITDVTEDFRSALQAIEEGRHHLDEVKALLWSEGQNEEEMTVLPQIEAILGMTLPTPPKQEQIVQSVTRNTTTKTKTTKEDDDWEKKRNRKEAVVVLGCTANPPHHGHIHCIREAHKYAEEILGYDVLFSTIAVAPYGYVKSKCAKKNRNNNNNNNDDDDSSSLIFDNETRLKILELLIDAADSETTTTKITADDDDNATTASFQRFWTATRTYGSALECGRALRPSPDVAVIVVVGGDRFKWTTTKPSSHSGDVVITLGCARSDEQYTKLKHRFDEDIKNGGVVSANDPTTTTRKFGLLSTVGPPTSSTKIRSILVDKETSTLQKRNGLIKNGYPEPAVEVLLRRCAP